MTDAQLIADHIARHGVTVCPPCTHALPAVEGWQDMVQRQHALRDAVRAIGAGDIEQWQDSEGDAE